MAEAMSEAGHAWYVVQTKPHQETKAQANLERQGFTVYMPRYLRRRRHARRVDLVARPLYPGYVFVQLDPNRQAWRSINSTLGVTRMVSHGDTPAPIVGGIVEGIRAREDERGYVRLLPASRLRPGDAIRVLDGAFADCLGLFEGVADADRVAILLDLLGRKVRVRLDEEMIEAVD